MSVVEVKYPETLDRGIPKDGGLSDLRMGTTSFEWNCKTCKGTDKECPGHFGHLELAMRMFSPLYLKVIVKILRCVCCQCSKLLIDAVCIIYVLSSMGTDLICSYRAILDLEKHNNSLRKKGLMPFMHFQKVLKSVKLLMTIVHLRQIPTFTQMPMRMRMS